MALLWCFLRLQIDEWCMYFFFFFFLTFHRPCFLPVVLWFWKKSFFFIFYHYFTIKCLWNASTSINQAPSNPFYDDNKDILTSKTNSEWFVDLEFTELTWYHSTVWIYSCFICTIISPQVIELNIIYISIFSILFHFFFFLPHSLSLTLSLFHFDLLLSFLQLKWVRNNVTTLELYERVISNWLGILYHRKQY